jgi:hypothetical protein
MCSNCLFTDNGVTIFRRSVGSFAFKGVLKEKLYLVDFILEKVKLDKCLITKINMGWLWYHRNVGMRNIHKLKKEGHILGQTHHAKNIMTITRSLEMLHMNLFGPITDISIGHNKYGVVNVDDYSRFTWVFFL